MATDPRRPNLSFRVAQDLGRDIVCGNRGAGQPFPTEAELCTQFGVSRTAVREAVKMLSAKGLVSSKPRQGIRVLPEESWNILDADVLSWSLDTQPSRAVLHEFFQMRVAIEPEAAALAARFADEAQRAAIQAALDGMAAAPPDSDEARAADVEFHVAILYATKNRFYVRMRDFIRTALHVSIRFTTSESADYDETLRSHGGVHAAIVAGNADTARRRMRRLVEDARACLDRS